MSLWLFSVIYNFWLIKSVPAAKFAAEVQATVCIDRPVSVQEK